MAASRPTLTSPTTEDNLPSEGMLSLRITDSDVTKKPGHDDTGIQLSFDEGESSSDDQTPTVENESESETVQRLLSSADMNSTNHLGKSALHYATELKYPLDQLINITNCLVNKGADPCTADCEGNLPVVNFLSTVSGHKKSVLKRVFDTELRIDTGHSKIISILNKLIEKTSQYRGFPSWVFKNLVDLGFALHRIDECEQTVVDVAVKCRHLKALQVIQENFSWKMSLHRQYLLYKAITQQLRFSTSYSAVNRLVSNGFAKYRVHSSCNAKKCVMKVACNDAAAEVILNECNTFGPTVVVESMNVDLNQVVLVVIS